VRALVRHKKWLFAAGQCLVSIGLLTWIFRNPGFRSSIGQTIFVAKPSWLAAGWGLAGVVSFLCALRWRIFLNMLGLRVGFWQTVLVTLVGQFFDTFVVGVVGGDIVRIAMLVGRGYGKSVSVFSVILDRLSGTVGLLVISPFLIGANHAWLSQNKTTSLLMGTVSAYLVGIAALLVITLSMASTKFALRLPEWIPQKARIVEMEERYFLFAARWPHSLRAVLLSVVMVAAHFAVYFCAVRAYGVQVPCFHFLSVMPMVDIITGLPISFGGVGVREQLFITFLGGLCQAPSTLAAASSMAGFLLSSVWGMGGFVVWSVRKASQGFSK
jgi:glycosyltransferase 2 family protein